MSKKDRPPHSCPEISYAQSRLVRIRDWAEVHNEEKVLEWAQEAWDSIDKVRKINKRLRIDAYGSFR